jgi:hypothetical protein
MADALPVTYTITFLPGADSCRSVSVPTDALQEYMQDIKYTVDTKFIMKTHFSIPDAHEYLELDNCYEISGATESDEVYFDIDTERPLMSENIWIKQIEGDKWSAKFAKTQNDRVEYFEVKSAKFEDIKKIVNNKLKRQLITSFDSLKYSARILLKRVEAKIDDDTTLVYDEAEYEDGDMHAVGSIAATCADNKFDMRYPPTHSKIVEYFRRYDKPFYEKLVSLGHVLARDNFESTALCLFGPHSESITLKDTWDIFKMNKALERMMKLKNIESTEDYSNFENWRKKYSD